MKITIGVDYGAKWSGLAILDQTGIRPLKTCPTADLLTEIFALLDAKNPECVVFGLPVNHRGGANPLVAEIQAFTEHFRPFLSVFFVDEFQTSQNLQKDVNGRVDDLSAVRILQIWDRSQE